MLQFARLSNEAVTDLPRVAKRIERLNTQMYGVLLECWLQPSLRERVWRLLWETLTEKVGAHEQARFVGHRAQERAENGLRCR